jgi:protein O-GlcNAc transferase
MTETSNADSASPLLLPTDAAIETQPPRESEAPANAEAWVLLGQRQAELGQGEQAISSFKRAVELEPAVGLHWGRLGKALAAKRRYDAAEPVLQRACALDPSRSVLHVALAEVLVQQNKADAAIEACQRALALDPDNIAAAVTEALILPPIYAGIADLRMWRSRFAEALGRLHARKSRWLAQPHGVLRVDMTNFYLAYQGEDDRALQSSYSDFLAALLGAAVPELQAPVKPRG